VQRDAPVHIDDVAHLLRDREARKKAAGITDHKRWNTAGDCEINDDLHAEGLPLPGDPPLPVKYGVESRETRETYFRQLPKGSPSCEDCGSGAHGERRFWELPGDDES